MADRSRTKSSSPARHKSPKGRKPSASKSPERKTTARNSKSAPTKNISARKGSAFKGSSKNAKSEDSMDTKQHKSCRGLTGMRVLAITKGLEEKGLSVVDLSGQGLTHAAPSNFTKKGVGIIDLSFNNIRGIPPEIKKSVNLVQLDLSRNGIRCSHPNDYGGLPSEIGQLASLEIIIISECNLPYIPPAIWKCKNLKILDISRNKINFMVPEIGNLEELQHLNAQQTNITTLPPEIAFCQELEELLLWGNTIESLPETMREMPNLKSMQINYRSFSSLIDAYMDNLLKKGQIQSEHIPPVIFEMPGLEKMDLSDTKINLLPEKCYATLKELYLENNYFQVMPELIPSLVYLEILDISGNNITRLPDAIEGLRNLQILKARNNKINIVSSSVGKLKQLLELCLGENQLASLPQNIGDLRKLKILLLDRNNLTCIPDSIIQLKDLHTLDLTDNYLETLPGNFYMMKSLTTAHSYYHLRKYGLWLHKNPLKTPPQEVWKTDNPENIYKYMKRLQIKKIEDLKRQKLIILGESQCGKTSLIRTMTSGKSFLTTGKEESTRVVDFLAWKTDNNVEYLIVELGGEEVYRNTHSLFLDPQALYLVVYDHRKYTIHNHINMIGEWLEMLYMHAPGAVVKLVGTQTDQCYSDIAATIKQQVQDQVEIQQLGFQDLINQEIKQTQKRLKNKDGFLCDYELQCLKEQFFRLKKLKQNPLRIDKEVALVTSAEGMAGMNNMVQNIELMTVNKTLFPNAQQKIPEEWEQFRMSLKMERSYFLHTKKLQKKAEKFEIELVECLEYLREIGDILWYDDTPELSQIIFHRPRALVCTLQGLFNHEMQSFLNYNENKVFVSKGGMDLKLFNQAKSYYDRHGEISRALLKSLWFYQKLDYDKFNMLVKLIPKLDLCYSIPQPDIPQGKYVYQPLLVMPCFNQDLEPSDISKIWSEEPRIDTNELAIQVTFAVFYPHGIFEKFLCRIQKYALLRMDWQNLVFACIDYPERKEENEHNVELLLSRGLDLKTYNSVMNIKIRAKTLKLAKISLCEIFGEFQSLVLGYEGLVWYLKFNTKNCSGLSIEECFPPEVFGCL